MYTKLYKAFCEPARVIFSVHKIRDPATLPRGFTGSGASCLDVLPGCVRDAPMI